MSVSTLNVCSSLPDVKDVCCRCEQRFLGNQTIQTAYDAECCPFAVLAVQ